MKKIIFAVIMLVIVAFGTSYFVFNDQAANIPIDKAQTDQTDSITVTSVVPETSAEASVAIKNFSFSPSTLKVKTGTKVTWTNNDSVPHTVTSDQGSLLNSSTLAPGQSFSFIFTKTSTEYYHCNIHAMMKGNVVVE